jgi:hypothetical protein
MNDLVRAVVQNALTSLCILIYIVDGTEAFVTLDEVLYFPVNFGGASFARGEGIIAGVRVFICIAVADKDGNEGVLVNSENVLARSNDMLGSDLFLVMAGSAKAGI